MKLHAYYTQVETHAGIITTMAAVVAAHNK